MIVAANILDRATGTLGDALPRLAGAIVLLVVGVLVARFAGRLVRRGLLAAGLDELADRFRVHDALARIGLQRSLSSLLGMAVRLALVAVVVVAAVSLLGLGALNVALNEAVLFIPRLLVALLLILLGVVVAEYVGDWVGRLADQMDLGGPLRLVAQAIVLTLFGLTALAQLGIPTAALLAVVGLVVVAGALTVALAFGLGGREIARELSAGRYVGDAFELGQTITVGDVSGEIVALDHAAAVLRTAEGETVRVPNHLLVESIVRVRT